MFYSMTGFGKANTTIANKNLNIEIKSLNSKTAEINLKTPACLRDKDLDIRKLVSDSLLRGKIEVFIYFDKSSDTSASSLINTALVSSYISQIKTSFPSTSEDSLLKIAMRLPNVVSADADEISLSEDDNTAFFVALNTALQNIKTYRLSEGKALKTDLLLRVDNIQKNLLKIEETDPDRIESIREKLLKAIAEINDKVDQNRFEQELIFYIEKLDINEEKVRLRNHIAYFLQTIDNEPNAGKKLSFIAQEMGREINTIGSKANNATIQQLVVNMKDELEKIKEQILNVL